MLFHMNFTTGVFSSETLMSIIITNLNNKHFSGFYYWNTFREKKTAVKERPLLC